MSPDAQRVLLALAKAEGEAKPGEALPLRAIAKETVAGNAEAAVRILGQLDLLGLVRTEMMGWHFGWLTPEGRDAARKRGS